MKYAIGQPVWVLFDSHGYDGWYAGVIVGYSKIMPGSYLADVPQCPIPKGLSSISEGYWRPTEIGLRPRDDPSEQKREQLGEWDLCPWQPDRRPLTVSE